MKLLRYGTQGIEKPGMMAADGTIRDLSGHIEDLTGAELSDAGLDRLRDIDVNSLPVVEGSARLGPCVGNVGKFVCIGLNYADHAAESGMALPEEPVVFFWGTGGGPGGLSNCSRRGGSPLRRRGR